MNRVLIPWRETRDCTHGSGEQYAFKHWFELETSDGRRMKVYPERKPGSRRDWKRRWWLCTVESESSRQVREPSACLGRLTG